MANHSENLVGKPPFGRLTVHKREGRYHWVSCSCNPAERFKVRTDHLKSGNTKSCGCLRVESVARAREIAQEQGCTFRTAGSYRHD